MGTLLSAAAKLPEEEEEEEGIISFCLSARLITCRCVKKYGVAVKPRQSAT